MAYEHIHAERANLNVALGCKILGVSRSGYYAWLNRGPSSRSRANRELQADIVEIHFEHRGRYGSPRIQRELANRGESVRRLPQGAGSRHVRLSRRSAPLWREVMGRSGRAR